MIVALVLALCGQTGIPDDVFVKSVDTVEIRTVTEHVGLVPAWSPDHKPWVIDVRDIDVIHEDQKITLDRLRYLCLSRSHLYLRVTYSKSTRRRYYDEIKAIRAEAVERR